MKLEFENDIIPDFLKAELGIDLFLSKFDIALPLVNYRKLSPLTKEALNKHNSSVKKLLNNLTKDQLTELLSKYKQSNNIALVITAISKNSLEPFHLFELYKYLTAHHAIIRTEKLFKIESKQNLVDGILEILNNYTEDNGSSLKLTCETAALHKELEELEKNELSVINSYENDIFNQTGINLVYPYPKELNDSSELISKAKDSNLVSVIDAEGFSTIEYNIPEELYSIKQNKEEILRSITAYNNSLFSSLGEDLIKCLPQLISYNDYKTERAFQLALIVSSVTYDLNFNSNETTESIECEDFRLPSFESALSNKYVPLSLKLTRDSNIIFGANMGGKTTVLKSVFFISLCLMTGLPVPCKKISSKYISNSYIHLRNSGNIQDGLSAFGDEISFLSQDFQDDSLIIADELFQSTNPISGTLLAKEFIDYFSNKNLMFLATTHLEGVLESNAQFYRMEEANMSNSSSKMLNSDDLLGKTPFKVVPVNCIEDAILKSKTPLEIALCFDLPQEVKKKIEKLL